MSQINFSCIFLAFSGMYLRKNEEADEIRNYITSYVITAYAISRGVRSEKTEFTFVVGEDIGWVLISSDLCYI